MSNVNMAMFHLFKYVKFVQQHSPCRHVLLYSNRVAVSKITGQQPSHCHSTASPVPALAVHKHLLIAVCKAADEVYPFHHRVRIRLHIRKEQHNGQYVLQHSTLCDKVHMDKCNTRSRRISGTTSTSWVQRQGCYDKLLHTTWSSP
jgi:hypothetical protein